MHNLILGKIEAITLTEFLITFTSVVAAYTDITRKKIYNALTFSVIILGLLNQFYESGFSGLTQSFFGIFTALLLLGWLFVFKVMGAGDVKLLMAFGAVSGAKNCLNIAILSLFIGVLLSIIYMIKEKKVNQTIQKIYYFFISLFYKEFELSFPKPDEKLKVPYGVALGIAAIWLLIENPLLKWGLISWN